MNVDLRHGDCVELMRAMPECSVDSIVTDPPYGLEFMGKEWDKLTRNQMLAEEGSRERERINEYGNSYAGRRSKLPDLGAQSKHAAESQAWHEAWAREALRVLKPGGHLLAFSATRTYHRMACAIEDAGFEIRDSIHWVYGSGFPKSLNVGKAIDKAAGAEREVVGSKRVSPKGISAAESRSATAAGSFGGEAKDVPVTAPATEEARRWEGWGTALKPAHEPIVMARKPLSGTVASNVLAWGTGGLNIDGCRVGTDDRFGGGSNGTSGFAAGYESGDGWQPGSPSGRWPANIVLDGAAAAALDQQQEGADRYFTQADFGPEDWPFVYQAKPSKRERNAGLDGLPEREWKEQGFRDNETTHLSPRAGAGRTSANANHHPTVKPVALMRHLVRLVTPPGGVVLDPFAGSGTTLVAAVLEGMNAIGCEMTDEYLPIIRGRVAWAEEQADEPEQRTLL